MDIKATNFVTIQGWMRTKLNLKGNELLAYAVIYGFSQTDGAKFTGSRKYLAEWCGCSVATIDRTLNSLVDKDLISRTSYITKHGYRAVEYAVRRNDTQTPSDTQTHTETTTEHNTTEPQPLLDEPQAPAQPKKPDSTEEVVDYLNRRAGTKYKPTTASTRKLVKARLKEGFTIDEFKTVIDKKCAEWGNNPEMAQYLRPETLFGPKFESYLNAKIRPRTGYQQQSQQQPVQDNAAAYLEVNAKYLTSDEGWF